MYIEGYNIPLVNFGSLQGNSNTFLLLFSAERGHSKTVRALVETSTPVSVVSASFYVKKGITMFSTNKTCQIVCI